MATVSMPLDFDQLLAPIPGEQPAGDGRAYAHRLHEKLNELRREDDPGDYDAATRPAEFKRADWPAVLELAEAALASQTKDLRVACHLIEALVRLKGLRGLHEGLALLRGLAGDCWDRLNPPLEADDPDVRSAPLANMLDDPLRGLCFPNLVRSLPILGDGETAASYFDWKKLQSGGDNGSLARRDAVLAATNPDRLEAVAGDAQACLDELNELCHLLDERLGEHAPSFLHLSEAISDCKTLAECALAVLRPKGSPVSETGDSETGEAARGGDAGDDVFFQNSGVGEAVQDRRAIYQQIEQAANVLCRLEPHSPVPYLVKRAVELGRMPFPQMIRQLVREENILSELYRELGIDDAVAGIEPAASS